MHRREFLKSAFGCGALCAASTCLGLLGSRPARAAVPPPLVQRALVNVTLFGGPDFRHLCPPPFNPNPRSYGYRYWENKAASHAIGNDPSAYQARWLNDYFHVSDGSASFGILGSCGWLKRMWDAGHVAIICNTSLGEDRDHEHCQLILDQGDPTSSLNEMEKSGWGGRLAYAANGKVLALTRSPRRFCYGPHPSNPLLHDNRNLVSIKNTRDMSLYSVPSGESATSINSIISRSVQSYYAALREEMNRGSVFYRFVEQERSIRLFGSQVRDRLESITLPASIEMLQASLSDVYLGEQIRNLYDSIVCNDIFGMRVVSLEHGSWDSHKNQKDMIEPLFQDLFGDGMALDSLYQTLSAETADNLVFVLAGEFGRQIRSNRDGGSDHGRGNSVLVIGNQVQGGVYGDMFPEGELARLEDRSPDITGITSMQHVFGAVCDWVYPGAGNVVFPHLSAASIEPGLDLSTLFS